MTAPTDKLKALHSRLTDVLSEAMDDLDMTDPLLAQANLGVMKLVSTFLKDNSITADLGAGDDADETAAKLQELKSKRRTATLPTEMLN